MTHAKHSFFPIEYCSLFPCQACISREKNILIWRKQKKSILQQLRTFSYFPDISKTCSLLTVYFSDAPSEARKHIAKRTCTDAAIKQAHRKDLVPESYSPYKALPSSGVIKLCLRVSQWTGCLDPPTTFVLEHKNMSHNISNQMTTAVRGN